MKHNMEHGNRSGTADETTVRRLLSWVMSEIFIETDSSRNWYEIDLRSNEQYLSSNESKAWKKFRPVRDLWHLQYLFLIRVDM